MAHKNGEYALITGGTSGIGYELAKLFAQHGYNLIIVARTEERLNETCEDLGQHGVEVIPLEKDLFEPNAPREIYEEVKSRGFTVSALVNNAAQGQSGYFSRSHLNDTWTLCS